MAQTMNQKAILGLAKNNYLYTVDVVNYYKKISVLNSEKSANSALNRLVNNSLIRRVELGIYKIL